MNFCLILIYRMKYHVKINNNNLIKQLMIKSIFILLFLSSVSISLYSQETQAVKSDSIIFETIVYDYGTIEQGSDGNCEFKFTNKGESPLILSNVRASCGCTAPKWTKEPVQPGANGTIDVSYNTNLVGAFNKTITVNSNAANSVVTLRIKGNVVPKQ